MFPYLYSYPIPVYYQAPVVLPLPLTAINGQAPAIVGPLARPRQPTQDPYRPSTLPKDYYTYRNKGV
jgi:hypothetical protein